MNKSAFPEMKGAFFYENPQLYDEKKLRILIYLTVRMHVVVI